MTPLLSIPVGVVVERSKGSSPWADYLWRPRSVLTGEPDTPAWTMLSDDGERATFYAGAAAVELHRTDTGNYRDNLMSGAPLLWVVLRADDGEPPLHLDMVTADPAEGEAMAGVGDNIVDTVPMPPAIEDAVAAFVAEHHVERVFVKRKRDRADPDKLARRLPQSDEKR